MGGHHAHGPDGLGADRVTWALLAAVAPVALVTLVALVWLWPGPLPAPGGGQPIPRVNGTIVAVEPCHETQSGPAPGGPQPGTGRCGNATVSLAEGPDAGQVVKAALPSGPGAQRYAAGEDVVLLRVPGNGGGGHAYQISDHDRGDVLWVIGAAFVLAIIAFGRWRGLMALAGLAVAFAVLLLFIIPAILSGKPPLLVAVVGAATITLTVLYLTHGLTRATSVAVVGTLTSLTLTGVLAGVAVDATYLSGIVDDSSLYLDMGYRINTQGLLLASIIIGTLGVLDDVTVTQAATVSEIARANPAYGFRQLYRAGARVGRSHIASVINTIVLAYAGAALPVLLLVRIGGQPMGDIVASPDITQEIVRSVVGTLGLIAAVPITTALAAAVARKSRPLQQPRASYDGGGDDPHDHAAAWLAPLK